MKKALLLLQLLLLTFFFGCKKDNNSQISLAASATQATVGQTVSVTLTSNVNASNWTVSPTASATQAYGLTTSKVNYFTFTQAGTYTVSVRARKVAYDSTLHQSLDSCWAHGGGSTGGCTKGVDSASVTISVLK
jgi:hypothetical protein